MLLIRLVLIIKIVKITSGKDRLTIFKISLSISQFICLQQSISDPIGTIKILIRNMLQGREIGTVMGGGGLRFVNMYVIMNSFKK